MGEATSEFKQQLRAAFDAMAVGQSFVYRRTFTDSDVALFCGVTGDYNPYHLDDTFARESWLGRRNLPGWLTASMATHIGGMLGFLATEMRFHYLAPVYVGDTITCTVTVAEKNEEQRQVICTVTFVNQAGVEVIRGGFRGFPSLIRLAR
jgi:3-hydroxybutyryl-CoA dehydratase